MEERLLSVINQLRAHKGRPALTSLNPAARLRQDLGLDSFDLAELTVRMEEASGVDVFAQGLVHSVAEVLARLAR